GGPSAAWDHTIITPGGGINTEAACVDGVNCEVFTLTVTGTVANWAGQKVRVQLTWQSSGNEYDIWIHQGGTVSGPLVTSAMSGPGLTTQTAYIDPATAGTGIFTIHVVPDTTPVVTDHYHVTATAVPLTPAPPPSVAIDSDPIGFTDRGFTDPLGFHSRVFAGELTLLSPNTVKISHTDDDGMTWVPDQSGGIASAVDHETIGGGPYHAPIPATAYPHAVYYASQDIAFASCSRSDDGGLTYGPSIHMYTVNQCSGLHGHIK